MKKSRRDLLLMGATGLLGSLAGCQEDTQEMDNPTSSDPTTTGVTSEPTNSPTMTPTSGSESTPTPTGTTASTPTATATPTQTETATPTPAEQNVRIESSSLETRETSYSTEHHILGTIVNDGDGASGELSVTGRFYDSDGNLLDSTIGSLHYLRPGETWECYIPYLGDSEDVASHQIDGEYNTTAPRFEFSDLSVANTSLQKGDYSASVTGTIQNDLDEAADYLGALARFWRDDVIIGGGLDNITEVPPGEDWSFDAQYFGYGDRWEDANGHDVIPELSTY